eukprot:scaffold1724_cov341-Pavlova_lutheri.AAC.38
MDASGNVDWTNRRVEGKRRKGTKGRKERGTKGQGRKGRKGIRTKGQRTKEKGGRVRVEEATPGPGHPRAGPTCCPPPGSWQAMHRDWAEAPCNK